MAMCVRFNVGCFVVSCVDASFLTRLFAVCMFIAPYLVCRAFCGVFYRTVYNVSCLLRDVECVVKPFTGDCVPLPVVQRGAGALLGEPFSVFTIYGRRPSPNVVLRPPVFYPSTDLLSTWYVGSSRGSQDV